MSSWHNPRRAAAVVAALLWSGAAAGQVATTNPLDTMKATVARVLADAGHPFTDAQNRELSLVMEEQRRASERLFGDIMDFSSGPVRGADRDRALSGIQWMNEAFEAKLREVLTPEQNRIWAAYREAETRGQGGLPALRLLLTEASAPLTPDQDRRALRIFAQAAERLRRAEDLGADPTAIAAIVDGAAQQIGELLTSSQADAVVAAFARGGSGGAGSESGPLSGDDGQALPAAAPDLSPVARSGSARRDAVLQALTVVARPTSARVGGAVAEGATATSEQIAQIRINNNPYTTENFGGRGAPGFFGGGPGGGPGRGRGPGGGRGPGRPGREGERGGNIEVIQRGGVGDYHGNFSFDFRDESLTARNAFADHKEPFQQRNINANVSGPFIRNHLTASLTFNQNEQENADTVVATTPTGDVAFGIVSPAVNRSYSGNGQLQLAERHALHFTARYSNRRSENNGVGGFTLPERAWVSSGSDMNAGIREFWAMGPRTIHEVVFSVFGNDNANQPVTRDVAIDVLDAFRSGGARQDNRRTSRNYTLTNLLWYEGDRLTFKTGTEFNRRTARSVSREGFLGLFTFSSVEDFRAGRPLTYRVTRGDPHLEVRQLEAGVFVQTDWRVNRRLTLFAGVRHEWQTNLHDRDNFDPRGGFAWSPGPSTVVRGGAGLFHQNFNLNWVEDVERLNGTRQYEVVVSEPSYPDPFAGGDARVVPPSSRRVMAPDLQVPYDVRASLSIERTLRWNVAIDAAYEFSRGVERLVSRNLNAPRPGQTERPIPGEGNILQLESTAGSESHSLRLGFRQRLSFLTYNANYTLASEYNDSEGPFYLPMNSYDPRADWGRAGFNPRHRYAFTVNVQAPLGTLLTMSGDGRSGLPYNITTGGDDNNDQNANDRPAGVARNSADGPRFFNVDMTLSKTFRLGARRGAQLSVYANMQNAFNLVNLRNPSGVMTSKYFGIPTSAADARDIEIGVRYQF